MPGRAPEVRMAPHAGGALLAVGRFDSLAGDVAEILAVVLPARAAGFPSLGR